MDPRLDEQEKALQQRARVAATAVSAAAAAIDTADATARDLLAGLGEAGLLGVHLPATHGGGGGGLTEVALVCEELGAASAGATAVVAAHLMATALLAAATDEAEAAELLTPLAGGERLAAVVLDGSVSLLDEPAVTMQLAGGRLRGSAAEVAGAATADLLVVPALLDGSLTLRLVEAAGDGVELRQSGRKMGLNGANMAAVTLADAAGTALTGGDARAGLATARDLARVAHAALCVGIATASLQAGRRHVLGNESLERSQAVQWMLADMATETEAARLLTWYAASRKNAAELHQIAAMARLVAADAAVAAARRAVQVMGAAGNQTSSGVERLYRDAKAMEVHHGAAEAQREAVARALLPDLFEDAPAR